MKIYIGLDVHCKLTSYVCQDKRGRLVGKGSVATSREGLVLMLKQLGAKKGAVVGLETGTQATWTSRILIELGMNVVVIDAREVRAKAVRKNQKSDFRDAFEICDGVRRGIYRSIVYIPPKQVEQLRRILSRRRHFVRICVMEINAAKYLCRGIGVRMEAALQSREAWERLVERPEVERVRGHLEMHGRQWALAREQVEGLEKELGEALEPYGEEMRLLTEVSGIGQITAATFIAVVGDPKRFTDSSKLASYLGLVPSTYDSGESTRHGRITKAGSSGMRSLLCEASHHAARPSHFLYPYWSRMYARSGYKRAVVAVAHRLARILFQMWRKNEGFDLSKLNVEYAPTRREKTVLYRLKVA